MLSAGIVRIGNEPVVKSVNGTPALDLSLAYNYGKKGQDGKKPTQWINATLWGERAEKLLPYLKKGDRIFVQLADVYVDTYTKKDGSIGSNLKARVGELELLGDKSEPQKPAVTTQETNDYPF